MVLQRLLCAEDAADLLAVGVQDDPRLVVHREPAPLQEDATGAEVLHRRHVVADEEDRPALLGHVLDLAQALLLEPDVADGQHLVDDQDLGLEVGGHREGQPHVHPAGIVLDRGIEEPLDLGEGDDLVELAVDLRLLHPQDRPVQVDVLAAGQLEVEPGPHLQQRADAAAEPAAPAVGSVIRLRIFRSVDFPAPLRPTIPTTSPGWTSNETSLRAQQGLARQAVAALTAGLRAEPRADGLRQRVAATTAPSSRGG